MENSEHDKDKTQVEHAHTQETTKDEGTDDPKKPGGLRKSALSKKTKQSVSPSPEPESIPGPARPSRSILRSASRPSVATKRKVQISIAPTEKPRRYKYEYLLPRPLRKKLIESGYFDEDEHLHLHVKATKNGQALNTEKDLYPGHRPRESEGAMKLLFGVDVFRKLKYTYAEWEAKRMKAGEAYDYDLYIQIALVIQPFVIVFLIWDVIATVYFEIPQLTWSKHNGIIWPLHVVVFPLSLYGWMMRNTHFRKGALNFWAILNMILVIPLFLIRGYIDWYLFNERYEGGSYFEMYTPGAENRPFDYDPNFQYEELRIAKFWDLEYENEDRQVAEILRELQNTDEGAINEGSEEV